MTGDSLKKISKNKKGYSFIEMIVSLGLFSVVFLMISTIYISMVEAQRSVVATQDIQESMKFVLEVMSKEIRAAQKSDETCGASLPSGFTRDPNPKKVFNIASSGSGNLLYFEDKYGNCVYYFIEDDNGISRLKFARGSTDLFVTPTSISISNLDFYIWDDLVGAFHSDQPYVTIRMDVESHGGKEIHKQRTSLQTTISSRYYE